MGISFLEKLRKTPETSQIPVVIISNYEQSETKIDAFKFGIKRYLIKTNYTPTELLEEIKKYLPK